MKNTIAAVVLAGSLLPTAAEACSCAPPGTPREELGKSTRVFLGEATKVERRTPQMDQGLAWSIRHWFDKLLGRVEEPLIPNFPYKRVHFNVVETFKGTSARTLDVATGLGGGDCGSSFEVGVRYVVYAYGPDNALGTGICSLTAPASDVPDLLADLRTGS
jgi:hypothetical protein